jgi:hypothetical protein
MEAALTHSTPIKSRFTISDGGLSRVGKAFAFHELRYAALCLEGAVPTAASKKAHGGHWRRLYNANGGPMLA